MTLENRRIAAVTAIFCSILWGSAFPTLKVLYRVLAVYAVDVPTKWQLAGFRFFIAALMVGLVSSLVFKIDLKIRREDLGIFVALGLLQTFLQYTFFYVGVGNTSGIISAILTTSGTFFTVIVAHLFIPGDRLNRHKTLGILLGFAGILVLNLGGDATFRPVFRLTGEGFLLGRVDQCFCHLAGPPAHPRLPPLRGQLLPAADRLHPAHPPGRDHRPRHRSGEWRGSRASLLRGIHHFGRLLFVVCPLDAPRGG